MGKLLPKTLDTLSTLSGVPTFTFKGLPSVEREKLEPSEPEFCKRTHPNNPCYFVENSCNIAQLETPAQNGGLRIRRNSTRLNCCSSI